MCGERLESIARLYAHILDMEGEEAEAHINNRGYPLTLSNMEAS
jgi:hypothetical protein